MDDGREMDFLGSDGTDCGAIRCYLVVGALVDRPVGQLEIRRREGWRFCDPGSVVPVVW